MTHERSLFAGWTDFTAVSLPDLLEHLRGWRKATQQTLDLLAKAFEEVEVNAPFLDDPDDVREYIGRFHALLGRFVSEFDRLLEELPQGVTAAHAEAVKQIYEGATHAEKTMCIEFKRRHITHGVKDEKGRPFVDKVYEETRGLMQDYWDLSNMTSRLKALVGTAPLVKVTPEFHGIGINLRGVWSKLLRRFRR